jgi:23S rRNA (guanosine2251-2'-O)-methyltransferase
MICRYQRGVSPPGRCATAYRTLSRVTQKKGGGDGRAPGGGGYSKRGKPRPGTGGYRRDKLEGKGPTPPAYMRPGHPAQRAAARAAAGRPADRGTGRTPGSRDRSEYSNENPAPRGTGEGPEMVAGRNSVVESLRAGVPALALFVAGRATEDERVAESVQLAADAGIAVLEAGQPELDRLTGGAIHQGVALRVRPYEYAHPDDFLERTGNTLPLVVALDGVTDPRNLGAILRSAAAFGATGLLLPSRRSAGVTAGAWKASAGALARLPVARAVNLTRAIEGYKSAGFFVAGLDAGGRTGVRDMSIADGPMVLVVGSEGRGLSRVVTAACDMIVSIPMASGNESLNAGIAASIALYEIAGTRAGRS